MSTSPLGGRVRFELARAGDVGPLSTTLVRDRILNNALHYADENARVLVNWMAPDAARTGGNGARTPVSVSTSHRLIESRGPFALTAHADGRAYRIRAEVFGASSGGHDVTFALVLSPAPLTAPGEAVDVARMLDRAVEYSPTSSSTPSWLTAALGSTLLDTGRYLVDLGVMRFPTLVDTASDPTVVDVPSVYVSVFAKTANVASTPQLYGVHVSEYVGGV